MSARCTGEPLSWLALERYHAGDAPAELRARVEAHVGECEACAASLRSIVADQRQLPALPASRRSKVRRLRRALGGGVGALALAAGVALFVARQPAPTEPDRVKGGDVAFVLVGDDATQIAEAGGAFAEGRRYKVLVTCPPSMHASWDVAVYEGARPSPVFPLEPTRDLTCGNGVALDGAFRVHGRDALRVCVVWREGELVDRAALAPDGARSVCKTLVPADD
ncbi:MAG: zf-HC2 domain-containing protein [Myxococcales bacterium]|nr:zf-HC2 domain-containing protein [Myxococcales bacterium]